MLAPFVWGSGWRFYGVLFVLLLAGSVLHYASLSLQALASRGGAAGGGGLALSPECLGCAGALCEARARLGSAEAVVYVFYVRDPHALEGLVRGPGFGGAAVLGDDLWRWLGGVPGSVEVAGRAYRVAGWAEAEGALGAAVLVGDWPPPAGGCRLLGYLNPAPRRGGALAGLASGAAGALRAAAVGLYLVYAAAAPAAALAAARALRGDALALEAAGYPGRVVRLAFAASSAGRALLYHLAGVAVARPILAVAGAAAGAGLPLPPPASAWQPFAAAALAAVHAGASALAASGVEWRA